MQDLDTGIYDAIESLDWPLSAVVRLALAALCGGLVGLEREVRGRQAGFRTNLLVCVGSAVVMLVSIRFAFFNWPGSDRFEVVVDPGRIAYGVMTGIGFLGAGAIVKSGGSVRGLTTAAGLWCVTAIGLSAGLGLYLFTLIATLFVVAGLWGLDYLEHFLPRTHYRTVILRRPWESQCVGETVRRVQEMGYRVIDWTFERTSDPRLVDVHLKVAFPTRHAYDDLERRLPKDEAYEVLAVRED